MYVVTPVLPERKRENPNSALAALLARLVSKEGLDRFVAWYYTPAALRFTGALDPLATVYDCMDELSLFAGADPQLVELEAELIAQADVVFAGGPSLYRAKRGRHAAVHCFPSSVDAAHFARARRLRAELPELAGVRRPRVGFYGVIDERMDLRLLDAVAALRPDWSFVLVGPVVKIDPASLPRRPNIHTLGARTYDELPRHLAAWDVAMMPFALNDATRFISPTKTLEYLAAGKRVVSTALTDVVEPYGRLGAVEIVRTPAEFIARTESLLAAPADPAWRATTDTILAASSWDRTWSSMWSLVEEHALEAVSEGAA